MELEKKLYDAALEGNVSILKALIQEDPLILDRISPTIFQDTPLHIATLRGHLEFAREILSHNPRLATESDLVGHLPLHVASAKGHLEIVHELLRVSPSSCLVRSKDGKLPLHLAIMKAVRVEVVSELAKACPESMKSREERGDTVLHLCVRYGNLEALQVLKGLLKGETDGNNLLNVRNEDGNTVLHLTTPRNHLEITNYLLPTSSIEPNAGDENGIIVSDLDEKSPRDLKDIELHDFLLQSNYLQQSNNNHSSLPSMKSQSSSTSHPIPPRTKKSLKKFFTFKWHNKFDAMKGNALAAPPKAPIIKCEGELMSKLQTEKRLKTDLEEAKALETMKLKESLHAIQCQLEETKETVTREREAAKKAISEATAVINQDTEKIDSLTAELETVKALLQSETQSKEEAKQSYATALTKNEELIKKLEEAEIKARQFLESTLRLEEKVSNLESQNQVICQQVMAIPSVGTALVNRPITPNQQVRGFCLAEFKNWNKETEWNKHKENQDHLIKCISQDLGFSNGRPIAACLIYKSLVQWKSFEDEDTKIFDCIIETIYPAIKTQENNVVLCYWLSNSATLLLLLQLTFKPSGAANLTLHGRIILSTSLSDWVSQGLQASPLSSGFRNFDVRALGEELPRVEARCPALVFKDQLTAFLVEIYGMIRDNLKKELSPMLDLCTQAPGTSRGSLVRGRAQVDADTQQALISHWQNIVEILNNYLNTMKENYVPPFLIRKVFAQTFWFINVQIFNSLLLSHACCSFSNVEYVKAGLAELEQWCHDATEEYAGSSWEELKHIKQAVEFLVIHQTPKKGWKEITKDFCPVLSTQQLYLLSALYWDDKYGTHSISDEVISNMKVMRNEYSNNDVSRSFLLHDHEDSSIPFSVDDIFESMEQVKLADVNPPPLLCENSGFALLLQL